MAQLVVRNLEDDVKRGLQRRAMMHGRSMEAEVRDILCAAVAEPMPPHGSRHAHREPVPRRGTGRTNRGVPQLARPPA